jgi:hypothetical protein
MGLPSPAPSPLPPPVVEAVATAAAAEQPAAASGPSELELWLECVGLGRFGPAMIELGCEDLVFLGQMTQAEAASMCQALGMKPLQQQKLLSRLVAPNHGGQLAVSLGRMSMARDLVGSPTPRDHGVSSGSGSGDEGDDAEPGHSDSGSGKVEHALMPSEAAAEAAGDVGGHPHHLMDGCGFHVVQPAGFLQAAILPRVVRAVRCLAAVSVTTLATALQFVATQLEGPAEPEPEPEPLLAELPIPVGSSAHNGDGFVQLGQAVACCSSLPSIDRARLVSALLSTMVTLNRERPALTRVAAVAANLLRNEAHTSGDLDRGRPSATVAKVVRPAEKEQQQPPPPPPTLHPQQQIEEEEEEEEEQGEEGGGGGGQESRTRQHDAVQLAVAKDSAPLAALQRWTEDEEADIQRLKCALEQVQNLQALLPAGDQEDNRSERIPSASTLPDTPMHSSARRRPRQLAPDSIASPIDGN